MTDYKAIVKGLEATLFSQSNLSKQTLQERLEYFRTLEGKIFSDDEYFWRVVYVVFYAGIKAYRISDRLDVIKKHLGNYKKAATYSDKQIKDVLNDPAMQEIWLNEDRVRATVKNAQKFRQLITDYGSFQNYVNSFQPYNSFENLIRLKEDLEFQFERFRDATAFHFLTDSGLPALKPDRVVCRVFYRLGIIKNKDQLLTAVLQGRTIAKITGNSVRYIDRLFVAHGQDKSVDLGIERGICSESTPKCDLCQVKSHCLYYNGQLPK
jgi:DNA-3-methyladenine glycosylase I